MSEVCKNLIEDYVAGQMTQDDFIQSIQSLFQVTPNGHTVSQSFVQELFTESKISVDKFKEISQLFTQITIENTVTKSTSTDFSYFDEDATLHLTDVSQGKDHTEDKTVIVETQTQTKTQKSGSQVSSQQTDTSIKVVAKPHQENRHKDLGPGTTLKERFVLLERLGQGGMGVVFKAKDLLKVEAHDKNPYVAIKVLTDAFKQYSGSFIALQREASKAQKLAHPNIATVYDFDRDGDIVFMTMEYLQGKPLNRLIKEMKNTPLPIDEALQMIEDLCIGLDYAHQQMLIHSDFKPGNCFLLTDGTVKLLDFGIARASSKTDEERENTMFDPGKLSAVTPAYATAEMFAGMDPDPRDDIYGLACVAYQLLSGGRHPFNKVASPKVKELGIKPKPIDGLNRGQQKALLKALEVDRSNRTATVSDFLEGLRPKKSYTQQIILGSLFVLMISAGIAYKPYLNFQEEQSILDKVQQIKHGNKALLIETIWSLDQMENEQRQFYSIGLRREIITFYKDRINAAFNPDEILYDHPKAVSLLKQVKKLYPDSVAVTTIEDVIKEKKDRLLAQFIALYNRYLDAKKIIKSDDGLDISSVIRVIKKIDPKHYILKDTKLSNLYLSEAEILISKNKYNQASTYIKTGLSLFPDHPLLKNLGDQLNIQPQ